MSKYYLDPEEDNEEILRRLYYTADAVKCMGMRPYLLLVPLSDDEAFVLEVPSSEEEEEEE